MQRILVTGACGQIGSELVAHLAEAHGRDNVVSTDIKKPAGHLREASNFRYLNVLDSDQISRLVIEHDIDTIFHMAAILSAAGERNPLQAYNINLQGLMNVLEVARYQAVKQIITPSSIAAFGPDAPRKNTPNSTPLNPTTMYGVTKVAAEKLLQYYHSKFGLDTRALRFPGIVSSETAPGGGTTDFAVDMYVHAIENKAYDCFIEPATALPFMYMPDAIRAILELARADSEDLTSRVYNVHAMSLTPADILAEIQRHLPEFRVQYAPDYRQTIAASWPVSIDDSLARADWNWSAGYQLAEMTKDMLKKLKEQG